MYKIIESHLFPVQSISPVSRSTINVSSGIFFLIVDASPTDDPSSCMPTKIDPGNSRHDMNG